MRRLTTLLSFLLVFTLGSIAFTILRNMGDDERPEASKIDFSLPQADMVMSNVRFVDTRRGKRNWMVESKTARLLKEKDRAFFEHVHITFYGKDGREMHLYSDRGELNTETRNIRAEGDIRGRSSDGLEFFTSTLRYDYKKREISTDDSVKIIASGFETEGVGMVFDVDNETFRLLDQVRLMGNQ